MRNLIRSIAVLVLLPSLAFAQAIPQPMYLPQPLPPQTVIGNPGGASGPAVAVPFSTIASTNLPAPTASTLGGVLSTTCSTHTWFNSLATNGVFGCSQPNFTDLAGSLASSSVTNSSLAQMPAQTVKCNPTSATANAQDCIKGTIDARDFGAVCNASTPDQAAFGNAITQAIAVNVPLTWAGTCKLTAGLTVSGFLVIRGVSPAASVLSAASGINAITVSTTSAVYFSDFGITYSAASAGDTAIVVTAGASAENANSRFDNLAITGPNDGIQFLKASSWVLSRSNIESITAGGNGIVVANSNNVDSGDSTAYGNTIICLASASCNAAVLWTSSGGFRFENNKTNGASGASTGWAIGFDALLASGAATSDIFITGNSFEGFTNAGTVINFQRSGATGGLLNVVISNNELGGGQVGIQAPADANGAWLTGVVVSGNVFEQNNSTSFGVIFANSVSGLNISGNNFYFPSSTSATPMAIQGTQTATNCSLGPNTKVGSTAASTVGSCTTVGPAP